MAINGFFNEFRFLSNFWPAPIEVDGIHYPSVEHAYQAMKTFDSKERKLVAAQPTPRLAKHTGYLVQKRPDWDEVRVSVMEDLLRLKFQNPELRSALVMTHPHYLEETNTWGDVFWGVCDGKGENHLGMLLMQIREENLHVS